MRRLNRKYERQVLCKNCGTLILIPVWVTWGVCSYCDAYLYQEARPSKPKITIFATQSQIPSHLILANPVPLEVIKAPPIQLQ